MSDIYERAIYHSHISVTANSADACLLLLKLKVPDFMMVSHGWKKKTKLRNLLLSIVTS